MQKLRAKVCLTFRLNHEPDTTGSSCCILLFAKLTEIASNSEIVSNQLFFWILFILALAAAKCVYFSRFNFDALSC